MIGGWGRHLGAGVAAVAWCGLLAAAACGAPAGRRQEPGVVRLVDGEAEQLFASDRICRSEEVFEWLQGSSATGPRWSSTAPGSTVRSSPEGLVVQAGTDSSVALEAKVKLDAPSVDVVDVVLGQLPPGAAVSLLWSSEGEGYSLGTSLRPTSSRGWGNRCGSDSRSPPSTSSTQWMACRCGASRKWWGGRRVPARPTCSWSRSTPCVRTGCRFMGTPGRPRPSSTAGPVPGP